MTFSLPHVKGSPVKGELTVGHTATTGAVDVYRDGEVVTVILRGQGSRDTPQGQVRTTGLVTRQYDSVEAYEADLKRVRTSPRFALAYQRVVEHLGVEEDARRAPPLPSHLRDLLPEHLRALSSAGDDAATTTGAFSLPAAPTVNVTRANGGRR